MDVLTPIDLMNKKLSVAIVAACPFPAQRGTPVRIFRTAEALSQRGHNVHVVTYHFGDPTSIDEFKIHRIPNIKTYQRDCAGPTYSKLFLLDPLLALKLCNVLKTYEIDLIHAHHYEGLLVSLFAQSLTKHPVIYDAHTILESELPSYPLALPSAAKRIIGRCLDNWLPKRANHIIAVTDEIKDTLIQNCDPTASPITVISNGVEYQHFLSIPDSCNCLRDRTKKIIYTGNFAKFQGIEFLLKAFREILKRRNDVRLCIVSKFPFDKFEPLAVELKIKDNIDVVQTGFDEVPIYLAQADIALNPRIIGGGIPQKLLNYMAAGKPIVSFEGSAKLIEHGKTGWVAENGNVADFSKCVLRLLDDPDLSAKLGRNARRHVLLNYTWEKAAEKIETIYYKVIEQGKSDFYRIGATDTLFHVRE